MHIHLRDDIPITPLCLYTARKVPLHYQAEADKVINELLQKKVLAKVDKPTDWVSPGQFVPKPNGTVRLVTDYTKLNTFVKRPVHPFPSSVDIIQKVSPSSKFFAKLDAVHGYFQIPLDEKSSYLTTFLLPSGRYRYLRAPMGLNASGDEFCMRSDHALEGLKGVSKLVDDILVEADSITQLDERLRALLSRCRKHMIRLSLSKLQIGHEVSFAGHLIGKNGIKPDPQKSKLYATLQHQPILHSCAPFWVSQISSVIFYPTLLSLQLRCANCCAKTSHFNGSKNMKMSSRKSNAS
jgi:hypothetical protein